MAVSALSSLARSRRVTQLTTRRNRPRLAAALDNVIVVASLPPSEQPLASAARWLDVEE